ncbi:MAG: hypothetical protein LBP22_11325 [Deltaproteobacteria bacterium]|nr:hypothetical protein [Deltaproteobacteria bacterium]
MRTRIPDWNNGYAWDGKTRVLNHCLYLKHFDTLKFSEHWSDSGGAFFLAGLIK